MPARRPAFRPHVESLEDRSTPAAGMLDPAFNGAGYALTSVNNNYEFAYDVLVQPDHKVVTVGTSRANSGKTTTHVIRHLENGQRDAGFGSGGVVAIAGDTSLRNAALQPDGKVLLAGRITSGGSFGSSDFHLVRLNANGAVDKTFGNKGAVTTAFGASRESAEAIAVRPDGKIVVAGWANLGGHKLVLARYNPNGSLDTSFGSGGKVVTDLRNGDEEAYGLALQPDGKIVVSGSSEVTSPSYSIDYCVARYTESGALDTAAGTGFGPVADPLTGARAGFVVVPFPGREGYALDVALQPDGMIVAAGWGWFEPGNADYAVARFAPDGTPDAGFNGTGLVQIDFTGGTYFDHDLGRSVALQQDGKIVVAGDPGPLGMGLARLNPDGSLDPTFGVGGRVVAPDGGMRDAFEVAIQPWDGKIVASGAAGSPLSDYAVARFLGDDPADPPPGEGDPNPDPTPIPLFLAPAPDDEDDPLLFPAVG